MGQRPDLTSFGRYTREALRTLFAARRELERLGGESVQPEHLLLALLDPDAGSGAALLQSLDVPCQSVRDELEARLVRPGQIADQTDLPLSPEMRSVLDHSLLAAPGQIGSRELLLGLLTEGGSDAARVLRSHGLTPERLRSSEG